ncbi:MULTISPECIES: pyridoxal phosphate-dependent aminotransferase [Phyllobacteriaceae]|mgnify:CR=1 FL=1|jgi:aspartate aminotransferase|uniref:Aminotransferase n=1 Tax=Mesorhizobium hungaricum TaxID=1566387 RepID=A0A1C2E197_9HYPH|nr:MULTISPECIES: pyridoxal phosphate-dependent aminotransferase [Mesorhizobium]MBN9235637.1 pyridoxal phosphate-dependent aminotransferase [Mesorhizobium sp.]MDQ0331208.1 aspartate aminotransferase [Mesorhizobium sp. YL-MeA3-2017]OCX20759.1 aspartate aminotransferase [Mesorhizobium hungaricum]
MTILSNRLQLVRPSETKAMTARAAALRTSGVNVIVLSQGEPDFPTPAAICDAGVRAIGKGLTRYTAVAGATQLREAICAKLKRDYGVDYRADDVTVGCGAKQVIFNALYASLDAGDETIIPTPCWVSYPDMVALAGGTAVLVPCEPERGFKLTAEALAGAITERTKWLMLNSPCNPTGAVYSSDELSALAQVLRDHPQVHVLSDDIYEKLVYEVPFASILTVAPDLFERTVIVNGVSKASAMTGWRVGYAAGPTHLIKAMNTIQGQTSSHTSSISQYAAVEAVGGDQHYVADFVAEFRKRRDLVVGLLARAPGLSCSVPDGAFYAFPSCAGLIGKRTPQGKIIASDVDFTDYLLDQFGVAAVPGSAFLAPSFLRISYASSQTELDLACKRIIYACEALT